MDVLRRAIASLTGELLYKRSRTTIADSVRAPRAWLVDCLAELGEFTEGRAWGEEAARIAGTAANPSGAISRNPGSGISSSSKGRSSVPLL
jgi:hypothetical protein